MTFNWNKLITYEGSQNLAFDSLSKQFFRKEFQNQGEYKPVGGVGQSQLGIEAIIVKPNNDEIGIQAKWFLSGTISSRDIGRRQQIIDSIKLAVKRPRLKKWILSIPINFSDAEFTWWKSQILKYPQIEFELWDKDRLEELLIKPENYGIKMWFFNDLEFNEEWFKSKTESITEFLSQKYKPSLHVAGDADNKIQFTLGNKSLNNSINKNIDCFKEKLKELYNEKQNLKENIEDKTLINLINKILKSLDTFNESCNIFTEEVSKFSLFLEKGNVSEASRIAICNDLLNERQKQENGYESSILFEKIRQITHRELTAKTKINKYNLVFQIAKWMENEKNFEINQEKKDINIELKLEFPEILSKNLSKDLKKIDHNFKNVSNLEQIIFNFFKSKLIGFNNDLEKSSNKLSPVVGLIEELINIHRTILDDINFFKNKEIIFLADRGIGKTHLILKACEKQVKKRRPAVIIIGSQITNQDTLKKQICDSWGISSNFSWHQIIQAMESYAETNGCRILFAFDALNESPYWDSIIKRDLDDTLKPLLNSEWFSVLMTARTSYAEPIFGSTYPKNAYILHNDMDIEEYTKKYFNHYKLILKNTSPSLRKHLNDRFFVTLISKTYGNPENSNKVEISLDNLDITTLFEDYIKKSDLNICRILKAPSGCEIVRKKLILLCKFLFKKNVMQLSKYKAIEIIEEKNPANVKIDDSWFSQMVNEGLLVDLTWQDGIEVMEFSHQRLGEYLIACSIVEKNAPQKISELIRLHSNNPRISDILEMVGIITPKYINKHLYEFIPSTELIDQPQVGAFFEICPKYIKKNEVDWLINYFSKISLLQKQALITKLILCAHFEEYPFNADFLSIILSKLDIVDRDLIWTEWIRSQRISNIKSYPEDFIKYLEKDLLSEERSRLIAELLKWFLTTTDRELRDKTTEALYWYGRKYPSKLNLITVKSLEINDPYISERLLSVSYGVSMALHVGNDSNIYIDKVLSKYVESIYSHLFKRNSQYSTTHILSRDYARRTIDLYLFHRKQYKNIFKNIKPPFHYGGIRKWGESEDLDQENYREGNALLGFDWGNYTLGRLVPNRSPYQQSNEFITVKKQLLWRVYQLGYTLKKFGEIDKEIKRLDSRYLYNNTEGKVDRYGKKYCWIAFYELAGYRLDMGLLKKEREWDIRSSEIDIDPSFPKTATDCKFFKKNLFDDKIKVDKWVKIKKPFDTKDSLVCKKINDQIGPWVMLESYFSEKNEKDQKRVLFRVSGVLVNKKEASSFVDYFLNKKDPYGREDKDIPDPTNNYKTYAGEIPWCETSSKSYVESMDFLIDENKKITKKVKYNLNFPIIILEKNKNTQNNNQKEEEVIDYDAMVKANLIKKIKLFAATSSYTWEGSSSNTASGANLLNKEIASYLQLFLEPQTFNFVNKKMDRVSFSIQSGSNWDERQNAVFLRKDLLDKYLKNKNKSLIWLIWGERQYDPGDYNSAKIRAFAEKHGSNFYRYYDASEYKS